MSIPAGSRARHVFDALLHRIRAGDLPPGARLPAHTQLAAEFGVAPMTVRQVLARLEAAGLVSRQPGRGTFVMPAILPRVLVLGGPALAAQVELVASRCGLLAVHARAADDALEILRSDAGVALVLAELGEAPGALDGQGLRAISRRWPALPLAAVISSGASVARVLLGAEYPLLLLAGPVQPEALERLFGLAPVRVGGGQAEDLERLPEAAVVVDRTSGAVVAWNRLAERLLGEALSATLTPLLPVALGDAAVGDVTTAPIRALARHDGRTVWVEAVAGPTRGERVLVLLRDRTAEHVEKEWLEFQAGLLDAVEHAIVVTDPTGHVLFWNRGAEQLYGWPREEVLGKNVGEVIVSPEVVAHGREIMARLRQGERWSGEFPLRRRDGREVPVLVTDSPVRDADGELIAIVGVSVDISDRKDAERDRLERRRLQALLAASEAAYVALGQRLAASAPRVAEMAGDARLPRDLRPVAAQLLEVLREVSARLDQVATGAAAE